MTEPRIVFYDQLSFQLLGADADIVPYAEFLAAFDALAAACRKRKQPFERIYPSVPEMLRWMSANGCKNNNKGRSAYAATLDAVHIDVDYVSKQTFAARNFSNILGPTNPLGGGFNYAAMPHVDPFRR